MLKVEPILGMIKMLGLTAGVIVNIFLLHSGCQYLHWGVEKLLFHIAKSILKKVDPRIYTYYPFQTSKKTESMIRIIDSDFKKGNEQMLFELSSQGTKSRINNLFTS